MTTSGMWRPACLHFWAVTGWMFPCQTPRSRYIHSFPVHMSSNQTTWLYDVIDSKHWAAIPPLPSRHALLPSYMGAHGHFSLKPTKCFGTALEPQIWGWLQRNTQKIRLGWTGQAISVTVEGFWWERLCLVVTTEQSFKLIWFWIEAKGCLQTWKFSVCILDVPFLCPQNYSHWTKLGPVLHDSSLALLVSNSKRFHNVVVAFERLK